MKVRRLHIGILIIVIFAVLFAFFVFAMSPPNTSNEILIKEGYTSWSVGNDPVFHGETIWATFADYRDDEAIKVGYEVYWGGLKLNTDYMSWEDQNGSYSTGSLTLNELMANWQGSESVFKFKHEEELFRVSFSIPNLENGMPKYSSLEDAWANKELYQIIEVWQ